MSDDDRITIRPLAIFGAGVALGVLLAVASDDDDDDETDDDETDDD